jgi:hypothetical protein
VQLNKKSSAGVFFLMLAYNLEDLTLENNKAGYIALELILDSRASKYYTYSRD